MAKRLLTVALLGLWMMVPGCVGDSKDSIEADKKRLSAYILKKAPKIPNKVGINFDDKVKLLGYRIEPKGPVKPGQDVELTMYWKSLYDLGKGWSLFTHVLDGSGKRVLNIDNVGPLREWKGKRQALPPSAWEPGKVYVDEQRFRVPKELKTRKLQIVTGVWKGNERLEPKSGPHDRQRRGKVATLTTSTGRDKVAQDTQVPQLRVNKLEKNQSITIDGKLEDDAWEKAPVAGPFLNPKTGKKNGELPVKGSAKVLWDDEGMYLGFEVEDSNVVGGFEQDTDDPHLWTKDTIEIMVDPDGDGDNKDYYEIQINPQNLVFDSRFDEYNKPKNEEEGIFGHQDWSADLKSAVTVQGTLDDEDDDDQGYIVEAFIPWKSFGKAKQAPPELGDVWRMNLYAMQNNGGVAWSPILGQGNFHKASRFGKIVWADDDWVSPDEKAKQSKEAAQGKGKGKGQGKEQDEGQGKKAKGTEKPANPKPRRPGTKSGRAPKPGEPSPETKQQEK